MNTPTQGPDQRFLDSQIYRNPEGALQESLEIFEYADGIRSLLNRILTSGDHRSPRFQDRAFTLMNIMYREALNKGGPRLMDETGLLFSLKRIATREARYDGFGEKASGDVKTVFRSDFQIPAEGPMVVDFAVTRNLPEIVKACQERDVDPSRLRVRVPRAVLALQLQMMGDEKRAEFEEACGDLTTSQFLMPDAHHVGDILLPKEKVALLFSPGNFPIFPRLLGLNESTTILKYRTYFRDLASRVTSIYAPLAFSEEFGFPTVSLDETPRGGSIAKLSGISRAVAMEVSQVFSDEGFTPVGEGIFDPALKNPQLDHRKMAKQLFYTR